MESRDAGSHAPNEQHTPAQIVCLYAMRDEPMYRELQTHLVLWHTKGHIRWLELSAGADVEQTLLAFVQQADCVLLLISSSFFATSLYHRVMENALAEQARRGVPVVPILARAFDWKESACGVLRALPDNELPIAEWEHQERAYENIRAGLIRLIPGLAAHMTSLTIRPKHFQARDLPKGYVSRPKAFDAIKHLLLHRQSNQTTAITTALRGAGGFGKTTLATALCHDAEIQAAFPDGILWIELGEQPPRPLDVLNGVLHALEPSLSGAITLEEARDRWRTALHRRMCLLVIDDVWQTAALEPLLEGGPQCVRLVTTRNDQVLPEEAARIWVDAMEPEEAIAVLCRGLPKEIEQSAHRPALETVVTRLGCWPLLLTLAHGMLADQVSYGRTITQALTVVEHAYQRQGVTAFHLEHARARHQAVDACLEVSLRHLEEFTLPRYQAAARYQELAVFPEDTDIPLATLRIFWQGTGELEMWETDELCVRLHRLSLLLTCDLGNGTIRLHDVMRSYLIQRAGAHLPALHIRFLEAYQQVHGVTRWACLPANETYVWQHLILHFCQAGQHNMLKATLTDLGYLLRKTRYVGASALEADFSLASTLVSSGVSEQAQSILELLHGRIVRISHLFRQVQTEAEIGGVLLSYCAGEAALKPYLRSLEQELPHPFLTAWHPLPEGGSVALLRTLHGHTGPVTGCAVSPDGRFIVSSSDSSDHTLKVWDAATGVEQRTLIGHTGLVTGCAVSPDGRFIVSSSYDGTLKVWDAATGAEKFSLSGHIGGVEGCAVSPDGCFIVSASHDGMLKVWDAATGREQRTLSGHTGVTGCAVSPDGRFIVSSSYDGTLKVWDAATGAEKFSLSGHTSHVKGCAVSPDGRFIVSFSDSSDQTLKVWDAHTGLCMLTFPVDGQLFGCAFHPDGEHLLAWGMRGLYFLRLVV